MDSPTDWPENLIATHSGLRGRLGLDLTSAVVERVIRAFATLLAERRAPPIMGLARDGRPEGRELAGEVARFAGAAGIDVVDFGEVSTPTAKLASRIRRLAGVVVVTASHLGPGWSGLKFAAAPSYFPVDARELLLVPERETAESGGARFDGGAVDDHADALCSSVDAELIRAASLRANVDGGVGSLGTLVLARLGCMEANPGFDVGLRLDADGDRLELIDERGEALDPEVVLPLAALARDARHVVKGADTSRMINEVMGARGGAVAVVCPGELHLLEELARTGADLAGEGNGGVVVPEVGPARDGLAAGILVLELLARSRRPLSELVEALPRYIRRRSTVPCAGVEPARAALANLAEYLGVPRPDDPEEGISFETGDGWALVRKSATEHVIRLTVETRQALAADALHRDVLVNLRLQPELA